MIDPNARVNPPRLEQLGTSAALLHCDCGMPLSRAVAEVVKSLSLTTQHLRRILEFANIKAYLTLYERKDPITEDGTWMKYISFCGGPALFEDIMDLLEEGHAPEQEATMPSREDYEFEPENYKAEKVASAFPEIQMEKEAAEEVPKVKLETLYSDLNTAISKVDDQIFKLGNLEPEAKAEFLKEAKQAILHDHSLGDIRKVASLDTDRDLDMVLNELAYGMKDVFWDDERILASFEKVSSKQPMPGHPLAQKFANWKEAKCQLETAKATKKVLKKKQASVLRAIKEAMENREVL